jgi:hypothetical protein
MGIIICEMFPSESHSVPLTLRQRTEQRGVEHSLGENLGSRGVRGRTELIQATEKGMNINVQAHIICHFIDIDIDIEIGNGTSDGGVFNSQQYCRCPARILRSEQFFAEF